jgi:hypothetical protein
MSRCKSPRIERYRDQCMYRRGRIGGGWGGCEGLSVFASRPHDVASAAGRIIKGTQICRALRVSARAEWSPRKVPNQSALPPNCRAGVRRRRLEFSGAQDSEAREWRRVGADTAAGVIAGAVSLSKGDRQETRDSGGGCNERQCQVAVARGDRGRRARRCQGGGVVKVDGQVESWRGDGEVLRADEREERRSVGEGEEERRRGRRGGGRGAAEGEGESLLGKSPRTRRSRKVIGSRTSRSPNAVAYRTD